MIDSTELFGDDFGAERMWGLKELPFPHGVDWLPLAPGWYVAFALLALVLAGIVWRAWRRWQRNAYRRYAVARIEALDDSVAALPSILRSAALEAFPRRDVAGLRGANWIKWLNDTAGTQLFTVDDARRLDELAYASRPIEAAELTRLRTSATRWLRGHRAEL